MSKTPKVTIKTNSQHILITYNGYINGNFHNNDVSTAHYYYGLTSISLSQVESTSNACNCR